MQGKILIVDAIATNRIVLKVKLKKAYYEVLQVTTVAEAVALTRQDSPDLVIAAVDLPDGGAAVLSQTYLANPRTRHIPVIATGSETDKNNRIETLEAGVRDVLYAPLDETLLLGRVRSLIRAHIAEEEWQMREDTCRALGLAEETDGFEEQGHCVLVSGDAGLLKQYARELRPILRSRLTLSSAASILHKISVDQIPDVFVLILPENHDAAIEELRVISTLRANARARHTGVIVVQMVQDSALGANALDLGADDLMTTGFDAAELSLRTRAVMRRKRMGEQLRATVRNGLHAAVFDPLTGLYNRRYAMPHLGRIAAHARTSGKRFAVMVLDLDHFKRINDIYGHAAGDAVLVEVANRLRNAIRTTDMVARVGGEEFVVIMPGTTQEDVQDVALRICRDISAIPFVIPGDVAPIEVTVSIGTAVGGTELCESSDPEEIGRSLLVRADRALYAAKGRGRNQVKCDRPAA